MTLPLHDFAEANEVKDRPQVIQPKGWPSRKGYANGMLAEGRILATGGVVGRDEQGVFPKSFTDQVYQSLLNIRAILKEGGAEPHHIVRLTWYEVDIEEYFANARELGRGCREVFGEHYPTMALVQVVRLVEPAARVEIEATAVLPPVAKAERG